MTRGPPPRAKATGKAGPGGENCATLPSVFRLSFDMTADCKRCGRDRLDQMRGSEVVVAATDKLHEVRRTEFACVCGERLVVVRFQVGS